MKWILALDQGTTSSRAIVFDQTGTLRSIAQKEFRQIYPQPAWVEHDAEEIWQGQLEVALEAVRLAGLTPKDIAGIGITNQRETVVAWDAQTGKPLHHAIVWQDRRTAEYCDQLKADGREESIRESTGLVIDAYFSGSKLRWLWQNIPDVPKLAAAGRLRLGTIDTWLAYKLSGGRIFVTDPSNASRTMLYNIHANTWDPALLQQFGLPREALPEVKASSEIYGTADGAFAGVPIAGIAGDQQAALFGQACHEPGMIKNTYGTGCFMLMNTGEKPVASKNNLLTTIAWKRGARTTYALEGSVFIGGAVVQWLRDGLKVIGASGEVEALAASVPDSGGIFFVPAFAGLGAPHWDPYARGAIFGLTRGSTVAHMARAALESIAYQSADLVHAMEQDSGIPLRELRVDGGAVQNNLLMQFQAGLLGVPVVRPKITETTALGAAYLAGLAVGVWKDLREIASQWREDRRFIPDLRPSERQRKQAEWSRAVGRTLRWAEPNPMRA